MFISLNPWAASGFFTAQRPEPPQPLRNWIIQGPKRARRQVYWLIEGESPPRKNAQFGAGRAWFESLPDRLIKRGVKTVHGTWLINYVRPSGEVDLFEVGHQAQETQSNYYVLARHSISEADGLMIQQLHVLNHLEPSFDADFGSGHGESLQIPASTYSAAVLPYTNGAPPARALKHLGPKLKYLSGENEIKSDGTQLILFNEAETRFAALVYRAPDHRLYLTALRRLASRLDR